MNIFIFNGYGYLGKSLCRYLMLNNHTPILISKNVKKDSIPYKQISYNRALNLFSIKELKSTYGIINLSGYNISEKKWTYKQKQSIFNYANDIIDRIKLFIQQAPVEPKFIMQYSSTVYYGNNSQPGLSEDGLVGTGFLSEFSQKVEAKFKSIQLEDTKKIIVRAGHILSTEGGLLSDKIKLFNKNLGFVVGSGSQGFSWIHIQDFVRAVMFLIEQDNVEPVYNLTSPNPSNIKSFVVSLNNFLGKKTRLSVPAFAYKLLFGQREKETILEGNFAVPLRLVTNGFEFIFWDLDQALEALISHKK